MKAQIKMGVAVFLLSILSVAGIKSPKIKAEMIDSSQKLYEITDVEIDGHTYQAIMYSIDESNGKGKKEIYKRPEMVHLLKDCKKGAVNLIFSQTRDYLAANTCDFCFLLKFLFDLPMRVDIVTDDDVQRNDTILDGENQRQNLKELAEKYTSIRRKDYLEWRIRLEDEMTKAEEK